MDENEERKSAEAQMARISQYYGPLRQVTIGSVSQYGQLLLRQALVINSGALLVFPAYLAAIGKGSEVLKQGDVVLAGLLFLAGMISAAFAAFSAYLNFNFNAHLYETDHQNLLKFYSDWSNPDRNEEYEKATKKRPIKGVNRTMWVSIVTGISSYACFVVACAFGANALLGGS